MDDTRIDSTEEARTPHPLVTAASVLIVLFILLGLVFALGAWYEEPSPEGLMGATVITIGKHDVVARLPDGSCERIYAFNYNRLAHDKVDCITGK
jgi:hypothetical protein